MRVFEVLAPAGIPESTDSSHDLVPNVFTVQTQRDGGGGVSAVSHTSPCIRMLPKHTPFGHGWLICRPLWVYFGGVTINPSDREGLGVLADEGHSAPLSSDIPLYSAKALHLPDPTPFNRLRFLPNPKNNFQQSFSPQPFFFGPSKLDPLDLRA